MLSKLKDPRGVKYHDITTSPRNIEILNKLLSLIDKSWYVVTDTVEAKKLLQYNIITISDGMKEEEYSFLDLVFYKLPPILLSNSKYFMKGLRTGAVYSEKPLERLAISVATYYKKVKHQTI